MRGGGAGRGVAGETCYSAGYGYKGPIVIARASQLRKTLIWTPFYSSAAASCFNMSFTWRWMEPPEKSVSFGFITVRIQPSLKKKTLLKTLLSDLNIKKIY